MRVGTVDWLVDCLFWQVAFNERFIHAHAHGFKQLEGLVGFVDMFEMYAKVAVSGCGWDEAEEVGCEVVDCAVGREGWKRGLICSVAARMGILGSVNLKQAQPGSIAPLETIADLV
jgi:hypothetical protein